MATTVRPYGNDLTETDTVDASGTPLFVQVGFTVQPKLADLEGYPFCSPETTENEIVGSYGFILRRTGSDASGSRPAIPNIQKVALPVDPLLPLTDIQVRNGIAYVSADSTTAGDPDLLIFDIRDPTSAKLLASLNTGPGIAAFALAGKRVYAAAASTAAQLHIVRLDSLGSMILEKKYQLALPYATATPPMASAIAYDRGKVYLGTEKWDGSEFDILDVSSPLSPVEKGALEIGSKVNDIYVTGDDAYIATAAMGQLQAIDVHDPPHLAVAASFSPSGWQRQEGEVVTGFEGGIDLGRTSGGYDVAGDHEAFVWTATSSPVLSAAASLNIPGGAYGMLSDRSHTFMATRQPDAEFRIADARLGTATSTAYALPIAPQKMTCDGRRLYILAHQAPYIYEISF